MRFSRKRITIIAILIPIPASLLTPFGHPVDTSWVTRGCVAAGIASLWGPMHGGANEACIRMLREIGTKERIPEFLARAKDKNDPFKLMGFGHRVYRNIDPRAKEMKKLALECIQEFERRNCTDRDASVTASAPVTASTGANAAGSPKQLRELFHLAVELERAALAEARGGSSSGPTGSASWMRTTPVVNLRLVTS